MHTDGLQTSRHAVQFYGSDNSLIRTVGGFLSEGLVAGEPAVVIATGPHQEAIVAELGSRLIDVDHARHIGELVLLDADDTLGCIMIDMEPQPELFERYVGTVIEQTLRGRRRTVIRAYGEMVDLLWREGRTKAAIQLEVLWNRLVAKYPFSLLCGYSMGHFYKQAEKYQQICDQHTHVIETGSKVAHFKKRRKQSA